MSMGKHGHEGWMNRLKLDPEQAAAQGPAYVESCTYVLRDVLLRNWADDPLGAQWHPDLGSYRYRLNSEPVPDGDRMVTLLEGRMDAVFRPEGAPLEVLDHEHTDECAHDLVPFVTGHTCESCANQYIGFRLCPRRCVSTRYAVMRLMESYVDHGGPA